jgi:multidrug efflux pump subunit AcrB
MNIPKLAIDYHQFTVIIFMLLLFIGINSLVTMPRTEDPPLDLPGASIIAIYPGGNPADLEELIANPIEEALNELEDIKLISSGIRDGIVAVAIEFNFNTNADDKFNEVVQQVNSIRTRLPNDLYRLEVLKWSSTDVIMLQLAVSSSTAGYKKLYDEALRLKKHIDRVPGIRLVEIIANPEEELRISLDMEKMAVMGISTERIEQVIQSNNANIPGGEISLGDKSFNVKSSGSYKNIEEIENTVVSSWQGNIIYLKDIAKVSFEFEDLSYIAKANGIPSLFITVKQKENLNIFSIFKKINHEIEVFKQELDPEIELLTVFDQAESVNTRINGFFMNLLQGIALVGLVIFLSLGFRASLLVILAIPMSIIIGLGWVDISGIGLQQISIAALVIALGLLVDNSIVVTENIERHIRNGFSPKDASIVATKQLTWPILSSTITTMLAFVPIIMMPDKSGAFIESLPVTVIFTLLASLLISLVLTPYLASGFFKGYNISQVKRINNSDGKISPGRYLQRMIEGPYRTTLRNSLQKPWLILLLSGLALIISIIFFTIIGVQFFPKAEKPQFLIRVHLPQGSSLENTEKVVAYVESVLDTLPEVKAYASNIGHGNPRIYYNIFPRQLEKNYGEVLVNLYRYDVDEFDTLIERLRIHFSTYAGARINVKEFEQGSPIEAPFTLKITGDNIEELKRISHDVEAWAREIPGLVNLENRLASVTTDIHFNINRDKAGIYGIPVYMIDKTIRTAIAGMAVSKFRSSEGKEFDMVLRLPVNEGIKLEDLKKIYVPSLNGSMIPLSLVAGMEFSEAPGIISHYNLQRDATLTADIKKGYFLDDIIDQLEAHLKNYNWPDGYEYTFTGELESRQESFGGMRQAGIIALIAIFAVLVLQFRSFRQPLIVLSAIPLAVIGSTFALLITGYSFSFTAFIGLISLIGIVVNNSIILVDYINLLLKDGKELKAAIAEAGETRFTPIILTTLTTIGGLLPLTLQGGSLWAPMGWTIIGGLLVSTMLTLIVVPVLYLLLEKN